MKISKRQFLMSGAASAFFFWLPAGTAAAQSSPVQIGLFTRARGVSLPRGTSTVRTNGHGRTGRGAALYVADPAVDARYVADNPLTSFVDASGRGFRLSLDQQVTPFMAGASGDGDETLYPTRYISDIAPGTPVSQATRDGLALNEIFRLMRRLGVGALHIPAGEFRTYGYLERIDFPLEIVGAGRDVAFIRNCRSSPTERDGYGILITLARRHTPFRITGVTLDGRAHERRSPGVGRELRNYPIAVNGRPQAVLSNCAFLNSPIDCMRTGYANGDANCWLRVDNCIFSNSFRNTISPVAGWNQQYTDCIIEKGGTVHGGTNPRYCIDVEPGQAHETIKNITFTNCTVREARNVVIGGVWAGNVRFVGCLIQAMGGSQWGPGEAAKPWFTNLRGGEFTFDRCRFEYLGPGFRGRLYLTNPIGAGEYARTQFVRLNGCRISGGGIDGYGLHMELNDVVVENSKRRSSSAAAAYRTSRWTGFASSTCSTKTMRAPGTTRPSSCTRKSRAPPTCRMSRCWWTRGGCRAASTSRFGSSTGSASILGPPMDARGSGTCVRPAMRKACRGCWALRRIGYASAT